NRLTFGSLTLAQAATYSVTVSNANGVTNSAPATLTVLPPPSSLVLITGLVLHLPFDNSLTDATTRGNNGTAQGNSSISYVSGKLGNALHYSTDTTGGSTNYVTLGVRPDLQFSSNVNFTIAYWVRLPVNYSGGDLPFFCNAVGATTLAGYTFAPSYGYGGISWP